MRTRSAAIIVVLACCGEWAYGQGICDAALVKSTYNSFSTDQIDYRLATLVSEDTYNSIKRDAGGDVSIFGISAGATYKDYQDEVKKQLSTYNESLTRNQMRNILWTGLDANSPGAYSECLKAQVLAARGLHLAVTSATKSDIAIVVRWNPQGADPATISPTWRWAGPGKQ
jgi:hypothetical protein